jgi:catechol 2,3-dioxygenase-like lactoylglutathione lyase family enzyme
MRLSLLVLKVRDIAQSRAFYELLGFSFAEHRHGNGPVHCCSDDLGFPLELYPAVDPAQNYVALGFALPALQAYRQRLVEHGIACSAISDSGFGSYFVVRDPDNNRVEIYEQEA